jgi:two-component system nitrate/nitrite response regulator NarL
MNMYRSPQQDHLGPKAVTLVLADKQPIVLDGLEHLFRLEKNFEILARCTTGEDMLHAVRKHRPDILVFDFHIHSENGLAILKEITKSKLRTRCVIFTAALNDDEMLEAIRLGVSGVVLKDMPPKLLIECIRQVQAGKKWFERDSSARTLQKLAERESTVRLAYEVLSARQLQILRMVAAGLHNKDIGKKLFISEGTVEVHLHNIYERLDVKSRLALALYARDKGLV